MKDLKIYLVFDDLNDEPFLVTLNKKRAVEAAESECEKSDIYTFVEEYSIVEHTDCFHKTDIIEFEP